ncbi:MAG: sulfatase-like hydrolase/transferase [Bacillota bacterium]
MKKPDILVFLSDQHNANYAGFAGDKIVRTPNLDKIASNGTVFDAAYTSCPLCVPARMSMLTCRLPSKSGIFTNEGAMAEDQATFVHCIAAEGYETVLCGRMHFLGDDQRHGFTMRLVGDITPLYWGRGGKSRKDLGPFVETLTSNRCLDVIGGGTSPVLEYDRAVVTAAIEYLKQDHDKPQFVVVGTYGPHFPYVAPPDLYKYYRARVDLPESVHQEYKHPILRVREKRVGEDIVLNARAAYYGMIENMDRQIGEIREAWNKYVERKGGEGLFVYLSDHGDQAGEHNLYGKETFYEGSARIPVIFDGVNIKRNNRISSPASIMDIGPTLCDLVGAPVPSFADGKSLVGQILEGEHDGERHVISEFLDEVASNTFVPGRMIRKGRWKLISYASFEEFDMLFDIEKDAFELNNVFHENHKIARELNALLSLNWNVENIVEMHKFKLENYKILKRWGKTVDIKEQERWIIPETALKLPIVN